MSMYAFDFFCGAGGLTRGLLDAGIKVIAGFDHDGACRETYESNNAPAKFFENDITELRVSKLHKLVPRIYFDKVLFAGCAPCQPFSQQRKGQICQTEATLLREFGRLISEALPGYVLMENVPGIARVKGFSTFRRFLYRLSICGYKYKYDVLDAKHYGVPQTRKRLVLIASRYCLPSLPKARYGKDSMPLRTVRQAISHFPEINAGEECRKTKNHVCATISDINLKRLSHTPPDGGDRRTWPAHLVLECHKNGYQGHTDVYGRMEWDKPSPTLTARCTSISNGRYGHPTQNRAISLREAAALQSFSDRYVFYGSRKHIAQQIGNAVPVRLAEALGKHIIGISKINGKQNQEF